MKHIPYGETRIVKKFCLLPIELDGKIYWFRTIYLKEMWTAYGYDDEWWSPISLSNREEYLKYKTSKGENK